MLGLYPRAEIGCQRKLGFRDYNGLVRHLGAYLIKERLRQEGSIEVFEALDPVTGGAVLLFRPLEGMPPKLDLPRVLPYELPVEDAWLQELPFGATGARRYRGAAEPDRLLAWARRLLATFAELEARGLRHGKLDLTDLWVRGEAIWVSGVGVPWPDPEPDAARLVAVLRELAGERWAGWPYAEVLESLAEGRRGYGEVLALLQEPGAELKEPQTAEPEAPRPPEPPPTVRVKGVKKPAERPEKKAKPEPPVERPPAPAWEPPEVVRIDEPADPAFEVVAPEAPRTERRRVLRGLVLAALLVLLAVLGGIWWSRRPPPYVQEVVFDVVPEEARAELVLLSAPEGSRLEVGLRAPVPGKLRFDREGVYTFEVQSPGYKPKTFALEVPVLGGRVTIRLSGR